MEISSVDMLVFGLSLLLRIVKSMGEWSTKATHGVSAQTADETSVSSAGISSTGPVAVLFRRHEAVPVRTRNDRGIFSGVPGTPRKWRPLFWRV